MKDVLDAIDLGWPVILALMLVAVQFLIPTEDLGNFRIGLSLGPLNIETSIMRVRVLRAVIAALTVLLLAWPAFRDYSNYFPRYYRMELFYDNEGIRELLSQFSKSELERFHMKTDWETDKEEYVAGVNSYIESEIGIVAYFGIGSGSVHSEGYTTFEVSKVKGWQRCHIDESKGELEHILEVPGESTKRFTSQFVLLETANNFIEGSIHDIYLSYTKILKPMYKQIMTVSATNKQHHHTLTAATKVRFFPVIDIGRTVYLVQGNNGFLVPIGYCIYRPQ